MNMHMHNKKDESLTRLENLEYPQVEMPAHKQQLKMALLAYGHLTKRSDGAFLPTLKKILEVIVVKNKYKIVVPVVLLALALVAFQVFFAAPRAVAYLTLQVNPAVKLSLNNNNAVIRVEGLDEAGKTLLAGLDVKNQKMAEAIQKITDRLHAAGFLVPERTIVVALHPAPGMSEENLSSLSAAAEQVIANRLEELDLQTEVESFVLSAELYNAAAELGLTPADYVGLIKAGISMESITRIISLQKELGIEKELFLDEFSSLAASYIDMIEAGMAEEGAISVLSRKCFLKN
ncbi:MAG: Anti-sigma-I factor RsgI6 [candidate division WS2 bacterium]|nr:Anti-sigma-I factor RsgI6 [Candidatus Psychracetigena formicireducens]